MAEFGTVAYLIPPEGKSLQASASPAGKTDFAEGTKTINVILIWFLHYHTSLQSNRVLVAPQFSLFNVREVLEFHFYVKSLAHSSSMIL